MKLWFVEPRPNIFISGVKDSVAKKVIEYLYQHCPSDSGVMIFRRTNQAPGYEIQGIGDTRRSMIEVSGLQLVLEKDDFYAKVLEIVLLPLAIEKEVSEPSEKPLMPEKVPPF
jgi:CRISPR-associated protein Cas2